MKLVDHPATALRKAGLDIRETSDVARAACPLAKIAGVVAKNGEILPWTWLARDHPTRVNLILESLGYEVRL